LIGSKASATKPWKALDEARPVAFCDRASDMMLAESEAIEALAIPAPVAAAKMAVFIFIGYGFWYQ
jgi:hypothetical protein